MEAASLVAERLGDQPLRSAALADLERRGSYTPRSVREQRAYRLAVVGGVAGVAGGVGLVLAIFDVIGAGLPILALIVAAICGFLFKRAVSR
jgi:hypothetical protein